MKFEVSLPFGRRGNRAVVRGLRDHGLVTLGVPRGGGSQSPDLGRCELLERGKCWRLHRTSIVALAPVGHPHRV